MGRFILMRDRMTRCVAVASCLIFMLIGLAFIPQAGIQNDEALFASGIYEQVGIAQGIKILGHRIPTMLNTYLGALKSWLYAPIFRFWRPSAYSLRIPVIFAGGLTVWLFGALLARVAGCRAAVCGSVLLATDTLFLITTCFDWGPVVLQHLLLASGAVYLVRFHQERRRRLLTAGFLLFGLALWDKSLFAWIFSGITIAAVAVFPRQLWKHLNVKSLTAAALAFCVGAAPLFYYNVRYPFETLRANAAYTADDVPGKSRLLWSTLSGGGLFGYIPRDDPDGHPRAPQSTIESLSLRVSDLSGSRQSGFFGYGVALALLLLPLLWATPARKPMAFCLIAMTIAWLQMLFAKGAGGSVHHVILLWPLPTLFVSVALAEASRRAGRLGIPLLAAAVLFLAGSSALVTNEYFARLVRNGAGVEWTDAIYPLSSYLKQVQADTFYLNDWGMFDALRMLNRGKLPLRVGSDPLTKPQLNADDRQLVLSRISEAGSVFVGHPDELELFTGVNAKLRALAAEAGYRREMLAEIRDRNGRTAFEVYRFEWAGPGGPPSAPRTPQKRAPAPAPLPPV